MAIGLLTSLFKEDWRNIHWTKNEIEKNRDIHKALSFFY